jgi:hypothetical protein
VAHGFDKAGITVLFGGDHGGGHCPISIKLNLTSLQERKAHNDLGRHCPVIPIASIKCSKDTYGLLEATIMPTVQQQMSDPENKSVVTVFDKTNPRQTFCSFMVPSSINQATIAFRKGAPTIQEAS